MNWAVLQCLGEDWSILRMVLFRKLSTPKFQDPGGMKWCCRNCVKKLATWALLEWDLGWNLSLIEASSPDFCCWAKPTECASRRSCIDSWSTEKLEAACVMSNLPNYPNLAHSVQIEKKKVVTVAVECKTRSRKWVCPKRRCPKSNGLSMIEKAWASSYRSPVPRLWLWLQTGLGATAAMSHSNLAMVMAVQLCSRHQNPKN